MNIVDTIKQISERVVGLKKAYSAILVVDVTFTEYYSGNLSRQRCSSHRLAAAVLPQDHPRSQLIFDHQFILPLRSSFMNYSVWLFRSNRIEVRLLSECLLCIHRFISPTFLFSLQRNFLEPLFVFYTQGSFVLLSFHLNNAFASQNLGKKL